MSLGSATRRALLGLSYRLRLPRVWDLVHPRRIRILIYHGIPAWEAQDGITNRYRYAISLEEFTRHMDYVERHCHVVSLQDAMAGRGLSRTRMNVVVSFDDGYETNYTNAFPVLSARGMPAVFAITTSFVCDGKPQWADVAEHLVLRTSRPEVRIAWDGVEHAFDLTRPGGRFELFDWVCLQCTRVAQERREELLETTGAALGVPTGSEDVFEVEDYRPMSAEQVSEMAASGLAEFASHSVNHFLLPLVGRERRREELVDSKLAIEALTGRACSTFCIPGGRYDRQVVEEIFDAGYERVLTSDDTYGLPGQRLVGRCGLLSGTDPALFADRVHGPVERLLARGSRLLGR